MSVEFRVVVYDREKNTMAVVFNPTEDRSLAESVANEYGDLDVRVECRHVGEWRERRSRRQVAPEDPPEDPWTKRFVVIWDNPVSGARRYLGFDTRAEADMKCEHYTAKYGKFEMFIAPRITEVRQ